MYDVVTGSVVEDAGTVVALWSNNFAALRDGAAQRKLEHSYLTNPVGHGLLFLLRHLPTQKVVGAQCLALRRFHNDEEVSVAGTMADYTVDAGHRSLGPALQLLKSCIAGSNSTLDFVYGLPNRKAEPILRRAGLQPLMQLWRYAAPLRSGQYLRAHVPGWLLYSSAWLGDRLLAGLDWLRERRLGGKVFWQSSGADRDAVDAIWTSALASGFVISERSAEVVWWRFSGDDQAAQRGDTLPLRFELARESAHGSILGYVVWYRRGDVAIVGDFLCSSPREQTARMMAAFRRRMRALKMAAISVECGGGVIEAELDKAGFIKRESSPVYAVMKAGMPNIDSWYMTGFDRDTE